MYYKIFKYNEKQLLNYIINNEIDKGKLVNFINKNSKEAESLEDLLILVDRLYKRINMPLDFDLKIFYLLFPFGIINSFSKAHTHEIERFREYGNIQKIKDYQRFSLYGILLYVFAGIIASFFV